MVVVTVVDLGNLHSTKALLLTNHINHTGTGSITPLAPISMHEMKVETARIMDTAMSPYHPGKYFQKQKV